MARWELRVMNAVHFTLSVLRRHGIDGATLAVALAGVLVGPPCASAVVDALRVVDECGAARAAQQPITINKEIS